MANDKRTPEMDDGNEVKGPATDALPDLPEFPGPNEDAPVKAEAAEEEPKGAEEEFKMPPHTVYKTDAEGRPVLDDRESRDATSRENSAREETWVPPDVLPMPDDRPGWVHRWVRVATMGEADARNVSLRFREGWEPVRAAEYPELQVMCDPDGRFAKNGNVEIGGLVLCRMPAERAKARQKYYEDLAARQIESVDRHYMRESDPRMPVLPADRQTTVTFGKG